MRPGQRAAITILLCSFIGGCKSSYQGKAPERASAPRETAAAKALPPVRIPPGKCRFIGRILQIRHDLTAAGDRSDPCAKVPCVASVRVDSVIGYGQGVTYPLSKGDTLNVKFKLTLSPSAKYFPRLQTPLPGLTEGSVFQADLEVQQPVGDEAGGGLRYSVLTYSIIRNEK